MTYPKAHPDHTIKYQNAWPYMSGSADIPYMPSGSISFGPPREFGYTCKCGEFVDHGFHSCPDPLVICLYCHQLTPRIAGGCTNCGGRIEE